MGSKAFLFLGLCLAILFLMSSEVVAAELAETSNSKKLDNENGVNVDGRSGYNDVGSDGRFGGRGHGGVGGGDKRCRYGCCKRRFFRCKRCCPYAGEATDKATQAQPHN